MSGRPVIVLISAFLDLDDPVGNSFFFAPMAIKIAQVFVAGRNLSWYPLLFSPKTSPTQIEAFFAL